MSVNWNYYNDRFDSVNDKYLLPRGEGDTVATQIVTAVNKLVYKWYNDGDVFDNTYYLGGWCNDLSSYANWLYENTKESWRILAKIEVCRNYGDYEDLLKELADTLLDEKYLEEQNKIEKIGTIYDCKGRFQYGESRYGEWYDEDDYYYDDDEE